MTSLKSAFWIGYYGFLELFRNRFFLAILILVLPLPAIAILMDPYKLGFQVKIVKDLGIDIMSVFGFLVVLFVSFEQIIPDIERKSVYFILSRIGNRTSYVFGRFLGIIFALGLFHFVFSSFLFFFLRMYGEGWFWEVFSGGFVLFMKHCVWLSMILFFVTFTSKIVALSLGILFYALGHVLDVLRMLIEKNESGFLSWICEVISLLIPDFSLFEANLTVVHEMNFQFPVFLFLFLYSIAVSTFFLAAAGKILTRRDL
ncbi:MAG: hypothetical protein HQM08_09370 [Candidatus Riflebacteria bacterium]|nr:hypothetical protein [Candidatus Riflebacteria bacterium]